MVTITNFERFRQGDFVQYLNNVLEIVSRKQAFKFKMASQRDALETIMERLNNAWQPQTGSELTPEIQELDNKRDLVLNGLKMTVDTWATNHYNPEWRNAAYIVANNIAGHGDKIYLMRYQQETATHQCYYQGFEC